MPEFQRYPMVMYHPDEQPAVLSDDYERGDRPPLGYAAQPGRSRQFPPVTVQNQDQEEYHLSRGYLPGSGTKEAFTRALPPEGYDYQEYPKLVDGVMVYDPSRTVENREYPKWVTPANGGPDVIVNNATEEAALLRREPSEAESELWASMMGVGPAVVEEAASPAQPEIERLRADAHEVGVDVDLRWGPRRLQQEIDQALAREASDAVV